MFESEHTGARVLDYMDPHVYHHPFVSEKVYAMHQVDFCVSN